jgi:serine protease AprX
MACPHVAGVAALVRQANPNLTVDEIKQILYDTAHDLGSPGEDNDYGWGMVDAYEAVMAAMPQDLPPVADFTGSPTSGFAPLTVQFDDLSQNGPTSWSWTFGDGGTSTEQDPSYTYVAPGTYTVTLVATNDHGSDTDTKVDYIVVDEPTPPVADFSATPTSGDLPLAVQFTDLSTGNPTSWSWTFGDGGTSTQSNPTHTYTVAGTYTVSLAVTNQHGSDVETKTDYIVVTEPQQSTLIVDSIIATRVWVSRRHMALEAEVVIVDQDGQPVSGATVYGYFNEPSTSVVSGTTGASGSVTFVSDRTKSPPASWCFTVTDVVLAGAVYDPPPTPPEGCN